MKTRTCSKCNKKKPLAQFYFVATEKRFSSHCIQCIRKAQKSYALNPNTINRRREYSKEYYRKNKKRNDERMREYYRKNKEQISKCHKIYKSNNKSNLAVKNKEYEQNRRDKLHPSYIKIIIKQKTSIPSGLITAEMIEAQRIITAVIRKRRTGKCAILK